VVRPSLDRCGRDCNRQSRPFSGDG
jgi:hypothetical protein